MPAAPKTVELPPVPAPFDQRVTVEVIDPNTGSVDYTVADCDALFVGGRWRVRAGARFVCTRPPAGSRITNDAGDVWVIARVQLGSAGVVSWYHCEVTKQAVEQPRPAAAKATRKTTRRVPAG